MPIFFDEKSKVFKLDTATTSYAFCIGPHGYLLHLYYGKKVSDVDLPNLSFTVQQSSFSSYRSEETIRFSTDSARMEYACHGCGDYRGTALEIKRAAGTGDTDISYVSHRIYSGKPQIPQMPSTYATEDEATTLEVLLEDSVSGALVTLVYTVFENIGAMTRHVKIKNASSVPFEIKRVYSACVDFHDAEDMDFIHLYGNWSKERLFERTPLAHATLFVDSKRGSSSHAQNPFICLCDRSATDSTGLVYGFNLVYSGSFYASAEMTTEGAARVLMGINTADFCWRLEPNSEFVTPEAVMVCSDAGLGGMSRIYHKLYKNHLCRAPWNKKRRPIIINNWEGTYFNFDQDKLYNIAEAASELGIEMLVMDDGWFGKRNNDRSSLGDWFVNEEKLRGGLGALVERVNSLGLDFGIWFEPEMISPDSDLYRAHPEWVLGVSDREKSLARHQYVLDISRADVRDYLFDSMKKILDSANIRYVKWDFNRNLTEVASACLPADRQGEVIHRYVLGLYELLDRILREYPDLLIEGCSGGGGRFDPAMLYYSPQIWASDDSDAIERLDIQYGTTLCYPLSSVSAHVSVCPNHQVGRTTPWSTRANVAMTGAFGYELDLTRLDEAEKAVIRQQCEDYKKHADLILGGELYWLISPWKDRRRAAWSIVSEDKTEALVFYTCIRYRVHERKYIRLQGLDPSKRYAEAESGRIFSGDTLMNAGICIEKTLKDFESERLYFKAID